VNDLTKSEIISRENDNLYSYFEVHFYIYGPVQLQHKKLGKFTINLMDSYNTVEH